MSRPLKQLLSHVLQTTDSWKVSVIKNWREFVGPLNTRMTLERVENDTVTFGVYDSCWMHELYLLSPLIIKIINENLDHPCVKRVRFKQARPVRKKKDAVHSTTKPSSPATPAKLNSREQEALKKVDSMEMRELLEAFRIRCAREKG